VPELAALRDPREIALQGLPCGEVVEATEHAKDDYAAACKDGTSIACT